MMLNEAGRTGAAERPMSLVLIEDDAAACRGFMECAGGRTDVVFVGMTGYSDVGMRYVRDKLPEGVILDLELNRGRGSGLDFLKELNSAGLSFRPAVVVTTRNQSELVRESLYEYGADWVFCKKQQGYSPETVISHLLSLRPFLHVTRRAGLPPEYQTLETPEELRVRVCLRIDAEMNMIGISPNFKGAPFISEAIFLLVSKDKRESEMVLNEVALKYGTHYNNVVRRIQSAINDVWRKNDVETLETLYKAHVRSSKGVPTPTEFIHYYADKIRRTM